jgi:pimeloyl-ACP methyl ester carboxylesterase
MQQFSSGGVRLAYIDLAATQGPGDPIVLVHGFASNHTVNWVNTGWMAMLARSGRRVVALDNRGHGASEKVYDPAAYVSATMAADVVALMDHLDLPRADIMGYSMGARITAYVALAAPIRVRSALLGGLGIHLVDGVGLVPDRRGDGAGSYDDDVDAVDHQLTAERFRQALERELGGVVGRPV